MSHRLLILDDEPMTGQTIAVMAEQPGVATHATTSPAEFFRRVDEWHPTHIALDLVMPEMDGVEVLVELARRGCEARIIITSGVGSRILDAAGRSAAEHGLSIAGVLSKPFSREALNRLLHANAPPAAPADTALLAPDALPTSTDLKLALQAGAIRPWFQPRIHCNDGRPAGFEALARWYGQEDVIILPDHFIPLAERSDQIGAVTLAVVEQAVAWFAHTLGQWPAGDTQPLQLSINIAAQSLNDTPLIDRVIERCQVSGIAPEQIVFELTESSAMADPVHSLDLLTRLRMKGFELAIDDFGTGYSSMVQLVRLPFSELKVDKSFVITALRSEESRAVIRSVIELAKALNLRVTAEGVEDQPTLDWIYAAGCDQAQGFHIGRPMPGEQAALWLREHASRY